MLAWTQAVYIAKEIVQTGSGVSLCYNASEAIVSVGKRHVTLRPDWSMSLTENEETTLDWIPLGVESAVAWLRGEE